MTTFAIYLAALLIGVIAGLRTFTAPAAVSWAAHAGAIRLAGTPLAFLGFRFTPWILTALALVEIFLIDPAPSTASRKTPMQFGFRLVSGAVSGAAIAAFSGSWIVGLLLGVIGAIFGTLEGADLRKRLANRFHRDRPAAILEDAIAVVGAALIVGVLA
ncbi:MAG TPA: hypothetical protein VMJ10_10685 [Kofleriaceae bacterium]|nr:hypothetical protein [Kofleriaceae bacterium]